MCVCVLRGGGLGRGGGSFSVNGLLRLGSQRKSLAYSSFSKSLTILHQKLLLVSNRTCHLFRFSCQWLNECSA